MGLFSWFKKSTDASRSASADNGSSSFNIDLVVPMISGKAWMDANQEIFSKIQDFPTDEWPLAVPYADGLFITYTVDPGPSWEVVSTGTADRFGDRDRLNAIAIANLRRRGDIHIEGTQGRFRLTVPDERDVTASLLLDPARWRDKIPIIEDLVVAIPTRIVVLICSAADDTAISELADMAWRCFEAAEGKPVSPDLYRFHGTSLTPFGHLR